MPTSTTAPPPAGVPKRTPPRRRSALRRVLIGVGAFVTVAALLLGAVTLWALNRYVFDHVKISDVAAYEAQLSVARSATSTTAGGSASSSETTESGAAPADSSSAAAEPVITDDSYQDGSTTITIRKVVTGSGAGMVTAYVADVRLSDPTALRAGFANNEFGDNIVETTSEIAADYDAVFAINGDYYGYRRSGIVIRNGVAYRDDGARTGLAISRDGTMAIYDETTTNAGELIAAGVWNTLSFGPGLVADGRVVDGIDDVEIDTNIGNHSIQGNQPRTGLGMIDANHYVFIVVDGRASGYSRGATMSAFAQMFQDLGCTVAYNLDGGGSSTMVFNGSLVNDPLGTGEERGTSDILYIAGAEA